MTTISLSSTTRRDGGQGRSYETPDGVFPSVTTVLAVIGKPALINWAAKVEREMVLEAACDLYEDAPLNVKKMSRLAYANTLQQRIGTVKAHEKEKQKACEIGSAAHKLVEWNLRRELGQKVGPEPRVTGEALAAFASYEAWRASVNLQPLAIEQTVWHAALGYAGTLDLLAKVDGELAVIDFKTSKACYDEYALQIAAYGVALNHMGHGPVEQGYIVRLPKSAGDGFEAKPVPEFHNPLQAFEHALALWRWQDANYQAWKARQAA